MTSREPLKKKTVCLEDYSCGPKLCKAKRSKVHMRLELHVYVRALATWVYMRRRVKESSATF